MSFDLNLILERSRNAVIAALGVALFCAFATTFAAVAFEPARGFYEDQANCIGAEQIKRADFTNGDLARLDNVRTMRKSDAIELSCTYRDGQVELVTNRETVIKGIILAFLSGFLPGFLIGFIVALVSQRRGGNDPPAAA